MIRLVSMESSFIVLFVNYLVIQSLLHQLKFGRPLEEAKKKGRPSCITLHTKNGDVLVVADIKEQVASLFETTNGKIKATVLCEHCKNLPCLADQWYNHIVDWGSQMEEHASANNGYGGYENKVIQFTIYQNFIRKLYGPLAKGNRKKLPQCVMTEIHDLYPAEKGTKYTGFKDAADALKEASSP